MMTGEYPGRSVSDEDAIHARGRRWTIAGRACGRICGHDFAGCVNDTQITSIGVVVRFQSSLRHCLSLLER